MSSDPAVGLLISPPPLDPHRLLLWFVSALLFLPDLCESSSFSLTALKQQQWVLMHASVCVCGCACPTAAVLLSYVFLSQPLLLSPKQVFNISSSRLKSLVHVLYFNNFDKSPSQPFFPPISVPPTPSSLLSNQIRLSPNVDQSRLIQTRGRGEEGDRRRRDHLRDLSVSDRTPTNTPPSRGPPRAKVAGLDSLPPAPPTSPVLDIIHKCRRLTVAA